MKKNKFFMFLYLLIPNITMNTMLWLFQEKDRGYHAKLLKSADQKFVMVGPSVDFVSTAEEKQLNFF